ncbi:D-aminoacyl-tRNA deacylase [Chlamydiota bacterium]
MRIVVQRVKEASVFVLQECIAKIEKGLLVFLAIREGDNQKDVDYLTEKLVHLRIFDDENEKMNLSSLETRAELLVVSQFTLYGDCTKGRRPSYSLSMDPSKAVRLYDEFILYLEGFGLRISSGVFQKKMEVSLINDGPVTLIIDSK